MLEVREMSAEESEALLKSAPYGHLACARDGHPYVVPMHFAYSAGELYFFTTEGTKTEFIAANREVCFQVEEVVGALHWRSVMLTGRAELLVAPEETERAMQILTARNPALSPALSHTKIGPWERRSRIALYRVRPDAVYGRKTA